jgi:N-formylglutamate amidohydrolase
MNRPWSIVLGSGPLVATAIHDGHQLRDEVAGLIALSEQERLREEDPFTGDWTRIAPTQVVVRHSRFEVDLNRPRPKAVYSRPEDAWGLQVWKQDLPSAVVERSVAAYDDFYQEMGQLLSQMEEHFGRFVVFDLHTYNHRREGPAGVAADPQQNPEVNLGTGVMDRSLWTPLVDRFVQDLRSFDFLGRHLDVRENVKFRGGQFSNWVHETYPRTGCDLAIEFKKFFMNEWTGELDTRQHQAILQALQSTIPGILEELARMGRER